MQKTLLTKLTEKWVAAGLPLDEFADAMQSMTVLQFATILANAKAAKEAAEAKKG